MGISNVKNTPVVVNSINTQKNATTSGYIKRSAADSFKLSSRVHVGNYPFSNIKNFCMIFKKVSILVSLFVIIKQNLKLSSFIKTIFNSVFNMPCARILL